MIELENSILESLEKAIKLRKNTKKTEKKSEDVIKIKKKNEIKSISYNSYNTSDFNTLISNSLVDVSDPFVVPLLNSIYESAKYKLEKNPNFAPSLIMLFAAIQEYSEAAHDKNKIEQDRKNNYGNRKAQLEEELSINRELIQDLRDTIKDLQAKDTQVNLLQIVDLKKTIVQITEKLGTIKASLHTLETNKDLKYFGLSADGNSYAKIHTQLMNKQIAIVKMLKELGLEIDLKDNNKGKGTHGLAALLKEKDE